jgi:esterase
VQLWLLHGILGSGRNWRSFGRRLQKQRPDLTITLVDLRGHGASKGFTAPHTVRACADDLVALSDVIGVPAVVCGHSFGGKVALELATRELRGLAEVWTLDSPPGTGPTVPGQIDQLIGSLRGIQMPVANRVDVQELLIGQRYSAMLAGWMTTNLERVDGGLGWRFDLDAVEQLLADYFEHDMWPVLTSDSISVVRRVLRAARSDRFSAADARRLADASDAGTCVAGVLADAGHWLHVDNPDGLAAWMLAALLKSTAGTVS